MRTQFSADEFGHDAKFARRSDTNAELAGDRTWLTRLDALYKELIASEKPEEVAAAALELAEACMDLEQQATKAPETLSPQKPTLVVVADERMPENVVALVSEKDAVVVPISGPGEKRQDRLADFIDAAEGTTFEPEPSGDSDEDEEMAADYDGVTCPHGRPEHEAILGKCPRCRRAENTYDDESGFDELALGVDDIGPIGD